MLRVANMAAPWTSLWFIVLGALCLETLAFTVKLPKKSLKLMHKLATEPRKRIRRNATKIRPATVVLGGASAANQTASTNQTASDEAQARSTRGYTCGKSLLPPFESIVWKENYPKFVNATVVTGNGFNEAMKRVKALAKKHPGEFDVLVSAGDGTTPSSVPPGQWREVQQSGARGIYAWNYNASGWVHPLTIPNNRTLPAVGQGVPLGLDLHTLMGARTNRGKTWWGEPKMTAAEQYRALCAARQAAAPLAARGHTRLRILAPFRPGAEPIR